MNNHQAHQADPSQPDFTAFDAAVRVRLAQHTTIPAEALEGVARLGRLVQTLRTKQHWSLQTLAAQTGLSWIWLALLEQGMLLPAELTPEAVQKLGQVFPTQHALARPEVLFHTLAEDLLHCQLPPEEAEQPHGRADETARPVLRDRLEGLVQWVSEIWCPLLAGEPVTASALPPQEQIFYLPEGSIQVSCMWWAASPGQPAGLLMTWRADVTRSGEFWVRFTRRDDAAAVLAELPLGEELAGEKDWSAQELGFDPTRDPWAVAVLLRDPNR
jgi:transcriptional regulator with XRE-family HTH domain